MIKNPSNNLIKVAGFSLFLFALFIYFKTVTAPTRWLTWNLGNVLQAFQKDAGQEAIRPEAIWMKRMADKRSDRSYRLLGELSTNPYISYPAKDYLYPIRITEEGPLLFAKKSEQVPSHCHLIDEQEDVALYECPLQ